MNSHRKMAQGETVWQQRLFLGGGFMGDFCILIFAFLHFVQNNTHLFYNKKIEILKKEITLSSCNDILQIQRKSVITGKKTVFPVTFYNFYNISVLCD